MPRRHLCISFSELPPRPRRLSESELSHVFGGCSNSSDCSTDKDCCEPFSCTFVVWGTERKVCL
jgi:hypothetical protein